MASRRHPCGEPAAPPDWSPIAAPVCREMRRSQRLKRRLAIAGFVMLGMVAWAVGYALQQVVQP